MTDPKIAAQDKTVFDPVLGFDRKVFAGTLIPPDLVDAYDGKLLDPADASVADAESADEKKTARRAKS